jgi:hypothetical protein
LLGHLLPTRLCPQSGGSQPLSRGPDGRGAIDREPRWDIPRAKYRTGFTKLSNMNVCQSDVSTEGMQFFLHGIGVREAGYPGSYRGDRAQCLMQGLRIGAVVTGWCVRRGKCVGEFDHV